MDIDYVLFDWGGTLGLSGTRRDFLQEPSRMKKLKYLQPGVLKTLNKLHAKGIPMGILSNTVIKPAVMRRGVREAGLDKFFTVQVYSSNEILECKKPCDDIFHHTFRLIKRRHPEVRINKVLYVGDSLISDVYGAWNAGMKTAYIVNDDYILAGVGYLVGLHDVLIYQMDDLLKHI